MKKPSMISVLLFLTGLLCIVALFFFNKSTLNRITTTEQEVDAVSARLIDVKKMLAGKKEVMFK